MTKALITVVIPCYNRAHLIKTAIQSVLRQKTKQPWKLLIVDDASTDQSVATIQRYVDDKCIQLIQMKQNKGISEVMNIALERVDTPYFIQLDSDDYLHRNALEQFYKRIKKEKGETALFYGNVILLKKNRRGKWRKIRYIRHRQFKDKYAFLTYLTYMLHPRCYRTEAVREVGGWETNDVYKGRIMEDRRMCLKLIEKYPICWIDKPLYYRRKHTTQLTSKEWLRKRNIIRKETIKYYLQKWGNKYRPVYTYRNGLLVIKKLIKNKVGGRT